MRGAGSLHMRLVCTAGLRMGIARSWVDMDGKRGLNVGRDRGLAGRIDADFVGGSCSHKCTTLFEADENQAATRERLTSLNPTHHGKSSFFRYTSRFQRLSVRNI